MFISLCVDVCVRVMFWVYVIGDFAESSRGEIQFAEISTPILEKVCRYFYFKLKYKNSTEPIPEFTIEPETVLELLMAANFLDV